MINDKENERVRVVVRCRPMNKKEITSGFCKVIDIKPKMGVVLIYNPKDDDSDGKMFTFDAVYDSNATQKELYNESVEPVVSSVLKGFNGTIFAYGQTGTGKTFTMEGSRHEPKKKGVIPKVFEQIFSHIAQSRNTQYLVRASYLEIYRDEVKDLLDMNSNKSYELAGNKSGIYVKNLKSHVCKSVEEMEQVMRLGHKNRKTGTTDMNDHSSRSHAVFTITVEMSQIRCGVNQVRVGKLNLVDLAGSEKQSKSKASGDRLKEASKINLSLSALGNVIAALSNGKNFHVPYRDSKLTRLLQDSLGGNSKTLMIANIGPASYNYDESLTTLRYANRAKNIKNKPRVNEDPKDALIREYQNEIKKLKDKLQMKSLKTKSENSTPWSNEDIKIERASLCDDKEKEKQPLRERTILLEEKRKANDELKAKIRSIESKLLTGENTAQPKQEGDLSSGQTAPINTAEEMKSNTKLIGEIGKDEEAANLQSEVERKKCEVNSMLTKLHFIVKQTNDNLEKFNKDRRELEDIQYDLLKQYKFNQMLIGNFIKTEDKQKMFSRLMYDDENEKWKVKNKQNCFRENELENEYRRELTKPGTRIRHLSENVISLAPTKLSCSTKKYQSPSVSPTVKCQVANALKAEDNINIDAADFSRKFSPSKSVLNTENSALLIGACSIQEVYPKPRGLVKAAVKNKLLL